MNINIRSNKSSVFLNQYSQNKSLISSILKISIPAIIEMSLNTLVGIVDTIMIGRLLGTDGLVAAGFSNQLIFTIIFIFSSFNIGATALISRAHGEHDSDKVNFVASHNLSINILISIVIGLISIIFAKNLLNIYDMNSSTLNMSITYFKIVSYSTIFSFISFAASAQLRGVEDTKTPMYITLLANIINIIGNYLLITGIGIFPTMGMDGAAWSTSISRFVSGMLFIYVLFKGKNELGLNLKYFKFKKEIFKPLWKISYPGAIEQFFIRTSILVSGVIVSKLDIIQEAAFRIIISIDSISFMPALGISIATSALVGKSLGEQDVDKSLFTGYLSLIIGVSWAILIGILFVIFGRYIASGFTTDLDVINATCSALLAVAITQVPLNLLTIVSSALRGAGDTKTVMYLSIARLWILKIPLCYLFIITLNTGVIGIWYSEFIAYTLFGILLFIRFKNKKWANIKV
jgi:putative MATE family efflux protein